MTLADEDTNSILTDNANRAIQGNMAMHVTQPKGKCITNASGAIWPYGNQCNWCHLVAKFATNASGAICWPNLEPILVASPVGQILN